MSKRLLPFPDTSRISQEASLWIAKLDGGELSESDSRSLHTWLQADDRHRDALLEIAGTFDETDVLLELATLFPLQKPSAQTLFQKLRQIKIPALPGAPLAAAVVLVCSLLTVALIFNPLDQDRAGEKLNIAYQTAIGEQASYTLVDNSTVFLNTDSQIIIEFTDTFRRVNLTQGEVHFEVESNPNRPFIVQAGAGSIRAVGTAFSVRVISESVDVTVTEGRVELITDLQVNPAETDDNAMGDNKTQHIFLGVGETSQYDGKKQSIETMTQTQIDQKLAWHSGMLLFEGESLAHVVSEINRYTLEDIVIADAAIGDIRVGGYFKSGDIEATIKTLEENFNIKADRVSSKLIYLSAAAAEE